MEELVNYTTAKLAQEKGFNIPTQDKYQFINWEYPEMGTILNQGERRFGGVSNWNHSCFQDKYRQYVSAPTQSQLQKWLREVHNINVYCFTCDENTWLNNIASHNPPVSGKYEEVLEIGLQEALKLIPYLL
ncbi:hypothetical protein [Flavobacterium phage FpV4]|uniref:Uncharacterized protein n=2 Tax=Fipvunavirus Fpv4 TaxID=2560476 RepID=A0A1B0WKW5_9CAUD|nr:hypothetical protein BOW80_gp75 [Flavobacterium phage Fpv3]YP_009594127.1 hypothetical protein FDG89_gp71 [Flavobacterium phage FpV4]ALN97184.1 hypothetical protein [Flavobacterium phage FpV4]ANB40477.1 hypothetical protein [Flavobacterium phage Fpv3]